jgi:hypothetical protein
LLAFESSIIAAEPPPKLKVFRTAFQGIALSAVAIVERLEDDWHRAVEGIENGSHDFNVRMQFHLPQLQKAAVEMDKIPKNPQSYMYPISHAE